MNNIAINEDSKAHQLPVLRRGATKGHVGTAPHISTAENRQRVIDLTFVGATQETIAEVMGCSVDTLQRHYRTELVNTRPQRLAKVAERLYQRALAGDVSACTFILKTQAGWKEKTTVEHSGPDGRPIQNQILLSAEFVTAVAQRTKELDDEV